MRGAQDAHVDGGFFLFADRAHGFFLNRAQQFHLHVQRQVGDFVEKQRAAVRGLKQAGLVRHCAGEAAFFVAEEFAVHEVIGNRAAVHRDERATSAGTAFMDQARDQLLASAGFTADVHRCLTACEFGDVEANGLHDGRVAEQLQTRACRWFDAGL